MEQKSNANQGLCKTCMTLGVIAVIVALLPLLSGWLMFVSLINWLLVPIGILCGIIGLVKSQNTTKCIIGILLNVLAVVLPIVLAEQYMGSALDSAGNAFEFLEEIGNM